MRWAVGGLIENHGGESVVGVSNKETHTVEIESFRGWRHGGGDKHLLTLQPKLAPQHPSIHA